MAVNGFNYHFKATSYNVIGECVNDPPTIGWILNQLLHTLLDYPVDAGYPNTKGYLGPYKNCKYHLQDYRGRGNKPRRGQEIFNHAHSSLRNINERCFGVLKARFPILKRMARYLLNSQMLIVLHVLHFITL